MRTATARASMASKARTPPHSQHCHAGVRPGRAWRREGYQRARGDGLRIWKLSLRYGGDKLGCWRHGRWLLSERPDRDANATRAPEIFTATLCGSSRPWQRDCGLAGGPSVQAISTCVREGDNMLCGRCLLLASGAPLWHGGMGDECLMPRSGGHDSALSCLEVALAEFLRVA